MSPEPAAPRAPKLEGLERAWPLAALVGLIVGYLFLKEGKSVDPGLRAALCGVGATLLVARAYAARGEPRAAAVFGLVVVAWASLVIGGTAGRGIDRMLDGKSRTWSNFHYYLGAKYFTELGYTDLYDQVVAADALADQEFFAITRIRNLETYEVEPMNYGSRMMSDAWSVERWSQFSNDALWFQDKFSDRRWRRLLRDRGYNATPTSNTLYWLLSRPELTERNLAWIGGLDPLLLLIAFVFAGFAFGPGRSLVSAAFLLIFFGNEFHVIGGPLLHDYLAALVLMACAVHRNRPMTAGILFGYACMTRVFPVLLLAGLVVWTVVAMRRDGTFPRFTNRFARGLLGAVAVLFVVGCLNSRGVHAWVEWTDQIAMHSDHHRFGDQRIGLQHVFTHDWSLDWGEWQKKAGRRQAWRSQEVSWMLGAALLAALWLVAAWRGTRGERDPLDSLVFALALVFAGIVLSRYYWSVACLFFLLGGRERDGPREAWIGGTLLAVVAVFYAFLKDPEIEFAGYLQANLVLTAWFVAALVARATWRIRVDSTTPDVAPDD